MIRAGIAKQSTQSELWAVPSTIAELTLVLGDSSPEEKKKQTRLRRRYADHHRQAFYNGDPLERRLSHPDPDARPFGPGPK
jgi:hypothetical protein